MSFKIQRKGNYFKLTETVSGLPHIERPAHSLFYRDNVVAQKVWFYYGNPNVILGNIDGYSFTDLVDQDENAFESYAALTDWLDENTGSSGAYTRGSLDVILNDSTTPILIAPFSNIQNETTLTAAFNRDTYDIVVSDPAGFDTLDFITVYNVALNRVFFSHPLSVNGNTITLSIPSDFDFPSGSIVTIGTTNMNVNGAVTPQIFGVRNPSAQDIPLKFDISRLMFKILTTGAVDLSKFGDITGGLARGVLVRRVDGSWQNQFHWSTNGELKNLCYDVDIQTAQGNQQDGLTAKFTFGGQDKLGVVVRIAANEDLQVIIQDDLTSLLSFQMIAEGSLVSNN